MAHFAFSKCLSSTSHFLYFSPRNVAFHKNPNLFMNASLRPYEIRKKSEITTFLIKYAKAAKKNPVAAMELFNDWKSKRVSLFEDDETDEEILAKRRGELVKYLYQKYYNNDGQKNKKPGNGSKVKIPRKKCVLKTRKRNLKKTDVTKTNAEKIDDGGDAGKLGEKTKNVDKNDHGGDAREVGEKTANVEKIDDGGNAGEVGKMTTNVEKIDHGGDAGEVGENTANVEEINHGGDDGEVEERKTNVEKIDHGGDAEEMGEKTENVETTNVEEIDHGGDAGEVEERKANVEKIDDGGDEEHEDDGEVEKRKKTASEGGEDDGDESKV